MPRIILPAVFNAKNNLQIRNLQNALTTLNLKIDENAVKANKIDETTTNAIKQIQVEFKLPADGNITERTIDALNIELHDKHITTNKFRTAQLHSMLEKLNIGISSSEKNQRISGSTTRKAIETFQRNSGLPVDGKISEPVLAAIQDRIVTNQFYSEIKNQRGILQSKLLKVSNIAKLNLTIDPTEIKNKELGTSSGALIKAFQEKYKLPATGVVDKATLDKITSVAASRGTFVKKIGAPPVTHLKTVTKVLRLNTVSSQVAEVQKNLSFLGYQIGENEFKTKTFGKTTTKAIQAFQKSNDLAINGQYDKATMLLINRMVSSANPGAIILHKYRIRGSVRNELWERKNEMVVKFFELNLNEESKEPLGAKKVFLNGFFDITYDPPKNPVNGKIKENFHLVIKLYQANDQINPVAVQKHFNLNRIHWVNFTEARNDDGTSNYDGKYLGEPGFAVTLKILQKAIGNKQIAGIRETVNDKQVSTLSLQTGLDTDEIMRHILSQLIANEVNIPGLLTAEVFYAFIVQNLPSQLPGDLLRGASDWETITQLTELTSSGIVFLEESLQKQAIDNAVSQNLVSQKIKIHRDSIVDSLANLRTHFTLTKPILTGNGSLVSLLTISLIDKAFYPTIANSFISSKGINSDFWNEIKELEPKTGATAILDFTHTVEAANVAKNHIPTVQFIKNNTGEGKKFKFVSDIAKLNFDGLVNLINENDKQVPDNIPGETIDEKVTNFAASIKSRSEYLFPAISLVASIKNKDSIADFGELEIYVDNQKGTDFITQNIDKQISDPSKAALKSSLKLVQRVLKLTNNPTSGSVLIDQKLHSSMQIYFMGRDRVSKLLKSEGVDDKQIFRVYESSKMQYMKILARFTDFRREMFSDTPAAIVSHTYSPAEIAGALGDIPDLEALFGSLDYCECEHCKSLYGPAAYLTDLLRFLKEHSAIDHTKTVKDILFERRPDLGNIKLNCENTNTPLPYIDLVCEILENNLTGKKNFIYQTTLSQKELRAIPENIQPGAYTKLASANFPMNISFNLWQEEARTYLNYLRVPRYELMEVFQNNTDPGAKNPDDTSIAAEFFNLSWKEKDLIITSRPKVLEQRKFWGFNTKAKVVAVSVFMNRSKLTYQEVLELLMVKFVNNPKNNTSVIQRSVETADTGQQTINHLTATKFDLMHRFIRLWRKSGWKMWELDLLLRNKIIGNNKIDGGTLVKLKLFKQLQDKLKLPFETLLTFYGGINREQRINPENQDIIIQPLFNKLFQNISVTNPIDLKFNEEIKKQDLRPQPANPLLPPDPANIQLLTNPDGYNPVPTLLSALAISQTEFDLLSARTNQYLCASTVSILFRYVYLARGLKLSIPDLLLLLDVINCPDPFTDIDTTFNCIKNLGYIKASGLSVLQLDYILNLKPESPVGLREESVAQLMKGLRRILEDSRNKLKTLNDLILYDTDALALLTETDEFLLEFSPLQGSIISSGIDFSGDEISASEIRDITEFTILKLERTDGTEEPTAAANKLTLITNLKKLQTSASGLLAKTGELKQNQIKSHIASSFNVTPEQASVLLAGITISSPAKSLLAVLENENLLETSTGGEYKVISQSNYPDQFKAYTLLHKSSVLVSRMKIDTKYLDYFIAHSTVFKTINFSTLPVSSSAANQYNEWLNLHLFLDFKSKFPEPENATFSDILDLSMTTDSTNLQIKTRISALTKWDDGDSAVENLTAIETGLGIRHNDTFLDYTNASVYQRLLKCFEQMRILGINASTALNWRVIGSATTDDIRIAQQTRQAVKSKYEQDDWLGKIGPLHDLIREKKRSALVEYHVDYSQRTPGNLIFGSTSMVNPGWKDSNSLFKYFLIDVEMSSCQLTSRIKQAISSVQLFVQRCFLNLENNYVLVSQNEKDDYASPNAWSQWKWMKNYRIWEANRKIFFYPENWLEPELRDDKSVFFKDLENDLMQNEATKENVENAFLNYLHKVDEVSHLEICGLYHQIEDLNPDEAGYETNIVHVIGRTKSVPATWFYRSYNMNYGTWSGWEKVEVDITGDHLVPVVYNRKLHLFWLQIIEKPMKAKKVPAAQMTSGPSDAPEPLKVMELQLGWTVKKTGGWASKKISKQKLIHPWERPHYAYSLKPYYLSKFNELYLDIYLSTSKEFNNSMFYDPFQSKKVKLTGNSFDETFLPWHSSSFIFNGDVKDVKLKGLGGRFYMDKGFGSFGIWSDDDSFKYVHNNFGRDGELIKELDPKYEYGPRLKLPHGMHFNNNHLTNNKISSVNNSNLTVLENTDSTTLLTKASNPFDLVITLQDMQFNALTPEDHPFFYQDNTRAFFIKPEWLTRIQNYQEVTYFSGKYRFMPFYHPYTMLFIREFNRGGIDGLYNRDIQTDPQTFTTTKPFNFFGDYSPTSATITDPSVQSDQVDFSFGGAYSLYNWELFFHAPLMVACKLMQNQKFEDAMTWFHFVFNPTSIDSASSPQRYWITKPFYEYNSSEYRKQRIDAILSNLNLEESSEQLKAWRNNPFKPHVIARYRPVAYQKNVVMKYIDNLVAWGDMLFKRDTIESINEASLLYLLAYEILGDRPQKVPAIKNKELTFNELENKLDLFGNARVDVVVEDTLLPVSVVPADSGAEGIPKLDLFYFCIPNNEFISKYWDTVEDRLYKIRHCMNISGIVRQLPLFEPPIDPAVLVKAAAAGIDISSVLNDLAAPTPFYRFRIVIQKAVEFCIEVKALGEKLLSALEKRDVEQLSLMRSQYEIQLLEAVKEIRKKQIEEAMETIGSLTKTKESAEEKKNYYQAKEINSLERNALGLTRETIQISDTLVSNELAASVYYLLPGFNIGISGMGGSPTVTVQWGTDNYARSAQAVSSSQQHRGSRLSQEASMINTSANYQRRQEDWNFQGRLADVEINQIEHQILAAELRQSIAEKELENQEMQIENAKAVEDYLQNKYTNQQLYNWMITQISTVFFQSYQLAFDMAKKAEKCYQYELGITDSNIIQFGYWDSLKKGLLSGDRLMTDLRRLEAEYINRNKREFEITKHISLAQISPMSLISLRETGNCKVSLPEWLFDMDYPGHHNRRIKNVTISIPCIVGPYTGVNCTLSLLKNETRMNANLNGGAYLKVDENDTRFKTMFGAISSIATSNAQNDSGMFELNFNDERYLPFEGAGVISDWQISMPKENNYFDFATLSDVILHISYSSKNGGGQLAVEANKALKEVLPSETARLFSLKHEFPAEWHKFLNPVGGNDQELVLKLRPEHIPFFLRGKVNDLKIKKLDLFVETSQEVVPEYLANIKVTSASAINDIAITSDYNFNQVPHASRDLSANVTGDISLKIKINTPGNDFKSLLKDEIDNILIICQLGL
jgi:peptidoglycan hydrolase-like protein with peptidoglycan-binding domain